MYIHNMHETILDGGYPGAGYTGYVTTAVVPGAPFELGGVNALGRGGLSPLGLGNYGLGGGLGGLPPKIRVIFIPQGGAAMGGSK